MHSLYVEITAEVAADRAAQRKLSDRGPHDTESSSPRVGIWGAR